MKLLPSAGPERTRLFVLLALLGIAGFGAWYMSTDDGTPSDVTTAATPPSSNSAGATGQPNAPAGKPGARPAASTTPQALQLAKLEEVPNEPTADRNPFRFGQRKVIAPPPSPMPAFTPTPTPTPTGPPPIPPVPLKLSGIMVLEPHQKNRAFLVDERGTQFVGVEGDIIDGRYRLLKVTDTTVIVSHRDLTGQRSLMVR